MGFNIHILSGRRPSQNLAHHAAVAASFNPLRFKSLGDCSSGYSLIEASSLEDAHQKAKGCPLLKAGGTVEIAQAMDM